MGESKSAFCANWKKRTQKWTTPNIFEFFGQNNCKIM